MKLAVIGAGSTYTPELVSGLMREQQRLAVRELVLHDIDPQRLEIVGGLARRMLERQDYRGGLVLTGELDRALEDASFVLLQLRVGGQEARLHDETVPAACGCVGQETTGAGGLAKAMRTVPVVLEIADRARRLAAEGAWIIDFTNPVGIVTRALLDGGHRAIGLCNVAITFQRHIAAHLGVAPQRVLVDQVGLNHLTWIRGVRVDGRDVLAELLGSFGDQLAAEIELPRGLLDALGAIPSYYLRYFYAERAVVAEQRVEPPRAEVVDVLPAWMGSGGAEPLPQSPLAPEMLGLVQHVAAYERLATEAARSGDRDIARLALMTNPLVREPELADELLEPLLGAGP